MNDNEAISYGRYLKSARLERGMTMKEVAAVTRVSRDVLEGIEAENHERLPAEVFVRGFIRSYAKTVGADGDRAVRSYEKQLAAVKTVAKNQSRERRSRQAFWPRLGMGLALMALIVAGSIFFLTSGGGDPAPAPAPTTSKTPPATDFTGPERTAPPASVPPPATSPSASTVAAENAAAPEPAAPEPAAPKPESPKPTAPSTPAPEPPPEPAAPETAPPQTPVVTTTQRLVITAVEETWLKVITDGMRTTEYMLRTGDLLQLEAEKGFNLLIGNAAGITMALNGQEIPVSGRRGQVITMQVP